MALLINFDQTKIMIVGIGQDQKFDFNLVCNIISFEELFQQHKNCYNVHFASLVCLCPAKRTLGLYGLM